MTEPKRSLQEATEDLLGRIDEEVMDDFLSDEFGEEAVENQYFDGMFNDIDLDYMFDSLVDSYISSIQKGDLLESVIRWRMLNKLTNRFSRWEVDEEEIRSDIDDSDGNSIRRGIQ